MNIARLPLATILHLVLEEQRNEKSCYVDMVHENQFRYELKEMGENKRPVIKKFDYPGT